MTPTPRDSPRRARELGVVLLLFAIGLEMRPEKLWTLRRVVFGLGSMQVVVTGVAIAAHAWLTVESAETALILGLGLSLSSTALVVQMLEERGEMTTEHGTTSFGILLLQDLAIVPLLALVPLLSDRPETAERAPLVIRILLAATAIGGVVGFGLAIAPRVLDRVARRGSDAVFNLIVFITLIGAALAMNAAGLSMALGAFLMGMLLSTSAHRPRIEAVVAPFKSALLGVFFIAVGMAIDVRLLAAGGMLLAAHMLVLMAIKAVLLFGLSLLFGVSRAASLRVALLLSQCGEFGFVLFGAALTAGLLTERTFAYAALLISMSMAATPLLARLSQKLETPANGQA